MQAQAADGPSWLRRRRCAICGAAALGTQTNNLTLDSSRLDWIGWDVDDRVLSSLGSAAPATLIPDQLNLKSQSWPLFFKFRHLTSCGAGARSRGARLAARPPASGHQIELWSACPSLDSVRSTHWPADGPILLLFSLELQPALASWLFARADRHKSTNHTAATHTR